MDKPEIKAVFFDIDGTLAGTKSHRINETDLASIQLLNEKGFKLFFATGRDFQIPEEIAVLQPAIPFFSGVIDVNGQHCALMDGTEISFHPLADEDFFPIRKCCEEQHFSMLYRSGNSNYLTEMTEHVANYWKWMGIEIPAIRPMEPGIHDIPKLCIHYSPEEEEKYLTPLMNHTWTARITEDLIDLIPNGIGKDSGIREMCRYFNISPEETMGFGDGQNDLVMLNAVGISVAMGIAAENVKAAADYVTLSSEEAGITHALKHFGLI